MVVLSKNALLVTGLLAGTTVNASPLLGGGGGGHGHEHAHHHHVARASSSPPSSSLSSSPSPSTPATAKRGLAFNDEQKLKAYKDSHAFGWMYNWGASAPVAAARDAAEGLPQLEFVPMLWGTKTENQWMQAKASDKLARAAYLLGYNEPDAGSQATMTVGQAVDGFRQSLTPMADGNGGGARLGSVAVTSSAQPGRGLDYLDQFLQQCANCKIDFAVVHWYGAADAADAFVSHIDKSVNLARKHGLSSVWVTEFQGSGDQQQQADFLKKVMPYLDGKDGVGRYAYFKADGSDMVGADGQLTELGKTYAGL